MTDWDSIPVQNTSTGSPDWDSIPLKTESMKAPQAISPIGTDSQNALAATGKSVADIGRGVKQLIDIPAQWLEKKFPGISAWSQAQGLPSAKDSAAQTNADVADSQVRDAPLMDTKAGVAGAVAGNIAATMLPLGIMARGGSAMSQAILNPTTYKAAMASGALSGALQPVIDNNGEARIKNMGVGAAAGAVGNLAANTIGRIAQPVDQVVSAAHDKAVQALLNAGVPLDASQRSGSTFLGKIRSSFSDNPFTAGAESEMIAGQKAAYNNAVLKTIGEEGSAATPDVMNRAATRINGVFKDVLDRNNVNAQPSVLARISEVQGAAAEEEKKPIVSIANRIFDSVKEDGTIPGQVAYGIKKDLDRYASSADTGLAYHARQLRSTLMDAINDSLDATDRAAFGEARGQFANMKKIEPAIDRMGGGDISASKLANVMAQKANRQASVYGRGDQALVDLAHAGNMLLPDKTANSGTTARAAMQIAVPLLAGGAEGAYTGDWEKAGMTAASLYALPKAAQAIMNNPTSARYLANGLNTVPIRSMLELPQTNQYIGGAMRRIPMQIRSSTRQNGE